MTFEIELQGRARTVSIDRAAPGQYRVTLDGQPHTVDARRLGPYELSLLLDGEKGLSREIQVAPRGDQLLITFAGRTVSATLNGRRNTRRGSDAGTGGQGEQSIVAPMPGRVVRVLVSAGDEVDARQGVLVVEAMKMENELRSPKKGRVKSVSVTPGTSVEAGRVLLVVE